MNIACIGALLATGAPEVSESQREPSRVWVFFEGIGRTEEALSRELEARKKELGARTLRRRQKTRGATLVDERDLLPAARYVEALEKTGAELRVQSRWLNAVSVEADAVTQKKILALPFVRGVYPVARRARNSLSNQGAERTSSQPTIDENEYGLSWEQLDLMSVPGLHACGLSGEGVVVGVQDTGFSLEHQAFAETKVLASYDFINDDDNVSDEAGDPEGQGQHGTLVLSLITGWEDDTFRGWRRRPRYFCRRPKM